MVSHKILKIPYLFNLKNSGNKTHSNELKKELTPPQQNQTEQLYNMFVNKRG